MSIRFDKEKNDCVVGQGLHQEPDGPTTALPNVAYFGSTQLTTLTSIRHEPVQADRGEASATGSDVTMAPEAIM